MKKILPFLLISFLLAFVVTANGQKSNADIEEQIQTFNNSKSFAVKFDKSKNLTSVSAYAAVKKYSNNLLGVLFTYKGQELKETRKEFILIYKVTALSGQIFRDSTFIALVNGKRKDFGEGSRDTLTRSHNGDVEIVEQLYFSVTREQLMEFIEAKSVDFRFGSTHEFSLTDEHKQMFKDMSSLLQ